MNIPFRYFSLVVLLIAVPVSAWAIAYRPMNIAVHSAAEEIRERTSKLTNYDDVNSQYREMKTILDSLVEANTTALQRIPSSNNADEWLESASDAAVSFGLVVQSVTTSGERDEGAFKLLPVDFVVSGKFASVYKLLQHLEQMTRLSRIESMTIHRLDNETVEVRFVIHLVFGNGGEQ
ncbi:MAG: type 4a pilus biogenesis protein PilO [Planctomycetes bacterium]|nr:type 4a pilus biogenesis protein PilO [Planctomycetota bacterium]